MWRQMLIVSVMVAAGGCGQDTETGDGPHGPSGGPTSAAAEPVVPDRDAAPEPASEGCAALASYLANGGSSHDDLYDPTSDILTVYSATGGRQFTIRPRDADCISRSAEVSRRVRDAVLTHQSNVGREVRSALLEAAS